MFFGDKLSCQYIKLPGVKCAYLTRFIATYFSKANLLTSSSEKLVILKTSVNDNLCETHFTHLENLVQS